jgi:hypothetical protein
METEQESCLRATKVVRARSIQFRFTRCRHLFGLTKSTFSAFSATMRMRFRTQRDLKSYYCRYILPMVKDVTCGGNPLQHKWTTALNPYWGVKCKCLACLEIERCFEKWADEETPEIPCRNAVRALRNPDFPDLAHSAQCRQCHCYVCGGTLDEEVVEAESPMAYFMCSGCYATACDVGVCYTCGGRTEEWTKKERFSYAYGCSSAFSMQEFAQRHEIQPVACEGRWDFLTQGCPHGRSVTPPHQRTKEEDEPLAKLLAETQRAVEKKQLIELNKTAKASKRKRDDDETTIGSPATKRPRQRATKVSSPFF